MEQNLRSLNLTLELEDMEQLAGLNENRSPFGFELSNEEMAQIADMNRNEKYGWY